MSAKTILDCAFVKAQPEPVEIGIRQLAERDLVVDAMVADIQFHDDAWNEYWCEAVRGGMTSTEAAQYATAMLGRYS